MMVLMLRQILKNKSFTSKEKESFLLKPEDDPDDSPFFSKQSWGNWQADNTRFKNTKR